MFQTIVLDENWAINCRVPPNDRDSAESEFLFKHIKYSPLVQVMKVVIQLVPVVQVVKQWLQLVRFVQVVM